MTEDRSGLHRAIEDYLESRRGEGWTAPGPEELLSYVQGELGESEARDLQQRLVLDRAAIDTLLDLERLPEDSAFDGFPGSGEDSDKKAWEDMNARIREDQNAFAPEWGARSKANTRRAPVWVPLLLGAACLALGFFGISQKRSLDEALQPTLDTRVVEIVGGIRDAGQDPPTLDRWQTLRFFPSQQQRYLRFRIDLVRASDGRVVYTGLTNEGAQSPIDLLLPRSYFKRPGTYRAEIYGERDGQWQRLGAKSFIVHPKK